MSHGSPTLRAEGQRNHNHGAPKGFRQIDPRKQPASAPSTKSRLKKEEKGSGRVCHSSRSSSKLFLFLLLVLGILLLPLSLLVRPVLLPQFDVLLLLHLLPVLVVPSGLDD